MPEVGSRAGSAAVGTRDSQASGPIGPGGHLLLHPLLGAGGRGMHSVPLSSASLGPVWISLGTFSRQGSWFLGTSRSDSILVQSEDRKCEGFQEDDTHILQAFRILLQPEQAWEELETRPGSRSS